MKTSTTPDSLLTVSLISRAMNAKPAGSLVLGGSDFYSLPNSLSAHVVKLATSAGYIVRLSHTQVQWTDAGLARARMELPES